LGAKRDSALPGVEDGDPEEPAEDPVGAAEMSAPAFEGVKGAVALGDAVAERETEGRVSVVDDEGGREGAEEARTRRTASERITTTKERHSRGAHCCCCSPRAATRSSGLHSAWRHERDLNWKSALVHAQVRLVLLHVSTAHEKGRGKGRTGSHTRWRWRRLRDS
jgi:hypothetical protein